MKKIKASIKVGLILVVFIFISCSKINDKSRILVEGFTLGDKISKELFDLVEDNTNLDFPYKVVKLKSDSNIIFYIVGEQNIVYKIKETHIEDKTKKDFYLMINKKLGCKPDSVINSNISNIWNCDMYTWLVEKNNDRVILSSCKYKTDTLKVNKIWELIIENDSIYNELQKEYNKFY